MPRYKRGAFESNKVTPDYVARELDKIQESLRALYDGELETVPKIPGGVGPLLIFSDGTVDMGDGQSGLYLRYGGNTYLLNKQLIAQPAVISTVTGRAGRIRVRGYPQVMSADFLLPVDSLPGSISIAGFPATIRHEETLNQRTGRIGVRGYQATMEAIGEPAAVSDFLTIPNGVYSKAMWSTLAQRIKAGTSPYASRFNTLKAYADARLGQANTAVANFSVPLYYENPSGHIAEKAKLESAINAAYSSAAVYYLNKLISGTNPSSDTYANKARDMLMNWANVNTSISAATDTGLVVAYDVTAFIDAAQLIYEYPGWTSAQKTTFAAWLQNVVWPRANATKLRGMQENGDGSYTALPWIDVTLPIFSSGGPYWSNHNCHGVRCSLDIAKYLGNSTVFNKDINLVKALVGFLIRSDGGMPSEIARGDLSINYTGFALEALSSAMEVIRNCGGPTLFNYTTPTASPPGTFQGGSLRKALDYVYAKAIVTPSQWPQQSAVGNFGPHLQETMLAMGWALQVPAWRNWATSITGSYVLGLPDLGTGNDYPLPTLMEHIAV